MPRVKKFSFKKVLILIAQGVGVALIIALVGFIFKDFLKAIISLYLTKVVMISVIRLAKAMMYVFIVGGILMLLIIHWVGWENINFKLRRLRYRSFLYAKDYYKEPKTVKYENFVGDITQVRDKKLDLAGPELDEALVGSAETGCKRNQAGPTTDKDGNLDGLLQTYHPNGFVESEVSYKKGILHGPFVTYYSNGRMHNEKFYRDGKLNGSFKAWDEEGHLFFEIEYKDDKQHGLDKIYYRTGVLQFEDTYVEGKKSRRKTFDQGGKVKFIQDYN